MAIKKRKVDPTDFVLGSTRPPNKKYRWCVIAPAAVNAFDFPNRRWYPSYASAVDHAREVVERENGRDKKITLVVASAAALVGHDVPQPPVLVRPI